MFCPNCGQKTNYEQSYCRFCGNEVGESSQNLSRNYTEAPERFDGLKRIGLFSIGVVLSIIFLFAFVVFGRAFRLGDGAGIFFLMFLITILSGWISVLYFEKWQSKKVRRESAKDKRNLPPLLEIRQTNRELNESSFQPIGSVTDHTTKLFTSKIPRTKTSGELS